MNLDEYFEKKKRLYPQSVKGRLRRLKWILNAVFLVIYYFTPFLRFSRGQNTPNQAILIDLPNSRAYFFAIEIWPQEVYYLMGILILAAITLFFVTSLFGRVWCGYACFQTVWTDIFIAIEKIFQGDRNARILLDRKNNFEKYYKKFFTHLFWILISLATGLAFVSYFNDAPTLISNLFLAKININIFAWIISIAGATYIMAGFAREHVCTYMCPYSRFQSAMFDKDTLIITYDQKRGEPRAKHKQGNDFDQRGDCIDCKQCVVVCPTGIDIRDGLQMECIACGLCVDACNNIMEKINRPKGLIRYDTERHLENPSISTKFKILRPRSIFYSTILLIICSLMLYSLLNKTDFELSVIPNRNPLYIMLSDGTIRNGYSLKIANKANIARDFKIILTSPNNAALKITNYDNEKITITSDDIQDLKIYVDIKQEDLSNKDGEQLIILKIINLTTQEEKQISTVFVWH